MWKGKVSCIGFMMTLAALPAAASGPGGDAAPRTPELAAKREMVRQQEEQRVTPEKRKAAAEALKAERRRVAQARKALQQADPGPGHEQR